MANQRKNVNNKEAHVKGPKKEHDRGHGNKPTGELHATSLRGSCKEGASLRGGCEKEVVPEGMPWGAMETDPQEPPPLPAG
jgi:hypothetical protein